MGARRWRVLAGLVAVMLVVAVLPALANEKGAQPRGVLFPVSGPGATGGAYEPAVDSNPGADNALVVWADYRSGTSAIWGRLVSLAGVPLGGDFRISPATDPNEAYDPAVAYNFISGQYLVVWSYDFGATDTDIYGQRVRANGSLAGARMGVASNIYMQNSPDVAFNGWRNHYLVVWKDDTNPTFDIFGQRVRGNGNPVGPVIGVATAANGATGDDFSPAVAFNTMKNTYQVVWTDGRYGVSDYDIFGQRIRGNGNPVGTSFSVSGAPTNQLDPDIAFDPYDMEFYVVWCDGRNKSVDIYGQLISSYSRLRGGQRRIGLGMGNDWDPVVSRSAVGNTAQRYLVAWPDTRYGTDFDIRGRWVSSHGNPQGTADFVIEGGASMQAALAMPITSKAAGDTYLLVWLDDRNATYAIWGRTFP